MDRGNPFLSPGVLAGPGRWIPLAPIGGVDNDSEKCSSSAAATAGDAVLEAVKLITNTRPEAEHQVSDSTNSEIQTAIDLDRIFTLLLPRPSDDDLSLSRNRTVLFYGDSIMRLLFADLCALLNGTVTSLDDVNAGYWSAQNLQKRHECIVAHPRGDSTGGVLRLMNVYVFGIADFGGNEKDAERERQEKSSLNQLQRR